MNKLIVFDLDGVLVDSKEIHFNSLNLALKDVSPKYVISRDEHIAIYDGLPTRSKLNILHLSKGLDPKMDEFIWNQKQNYSADMFLSISRDSELISFFNLIKSSEIKTAVASNSIRRTVDGCLKALGVYDLVDYSFSNEDVDNSKPSPEIYHKCMSHFGAGPESTVIFEDSPVGKQAAVDSGAKLVEVDNRSDLTFSKIFDSIDYLNRNV